MVLCYEHSLLYLTHHFSVPVIVLFTKYDIFLFNVKMHLEDYQDEYPPDTNVSEVAEKLFREIYLHTLGDCVYVRLESGFTVTCQIYILMFFGRDAQEE